MYGIRFHCGIFVNERVFSLMSSLPRANQFIAESGRHHAPLFGPAFDRPVPPGRRQCGAQAAAAPVAAFPRRVPRRRPDGGGSDAVAAVAAGRRRCSRKLPAPSQGVSTLRRCHAAGTSLSGNLYHLTYP